MSAYYDLFLSIDNDCYTVDINSNFQWLNPQKFTKNQLPESYYPSKDGLFDISDCPNFSKLQHFISEEIADEKPIAASFVYKQSKSLEKKPIFSNILY